MEKKKQFKDTKVAARIRSVIYGYRRFKNKKVRLGDLFYNIIGLSVFFLGYVAINCFLAKAILDFIFIG